MAYFRELFNRELNRPLVDFRPDELARVLARAARTADAAVLQEPEFQAARAQSEQSAEPEGFDFDGWYDKHQSLFRDGVGKSDLRAAYKQGYRDSQPAQQGSVPEGWRLVTVKWLKRIHLDLDACQKAIWGNLQGCDPAYYKDAQERLAEIDAILSATPQPESDGWIKCSERLPKLGQRVQLFSQGVIQHMRS